MEDGVETLALDSEAFDAAFGGKVDSSNQLARMSAAYIEVKMSVTQSLEVTLLTPVSVEWNFAGTAYGFHLFPPRRDQAIFSNTHYLQRRPLHEG
jgi:hypothetical protein